MKPSNHDDTQKNNSNNDLEEKGKEARLVRRIVAIVLTLVIVAIAIAGISTYSYIKTGLQPVDPNNSTKVTVEVPLGSSVSQIANILETNGLIRDSKIFRYYIKFKNEADFQAGSYQFSPSMTFEELIAALKTGRVIREAVLTVTIPEGKTIEHMGEIFSNKSNFTKDEFIEKVNDLEYLQSLIEKYPDILSEEILDPQIRAPLEGYLFAATYQFYEENPSIETIVDKMLTKTENVVIPYLESIEERDLSVHEAITLASLIENEAPKEEDRKLISGVFYNRLAIDMALQTDPTVLYAHGKHKERVLYKDLEIESPYNTYKIVGLPIGPISNFAETSLNAAINPNENDYYYFVASGDGTVYYAETYERHLQLKNEHIN